MLILGRKKGEEIVIGDNIVVKVQDIGADGVKLSIDAPREISVLRGELVQAAEENRMAAMNEKEIESKMIQLHSLIVANS